MRIFVVAVPFSRLPHSEKGGDEVRTVPSNEQATWLKGCLLHEKSEVAP